MSESTRSEHYRRLERMYLGAPTNRYYEPEIEIEDGVARIRVAVEEKFFHAATAVHGSVYFKVLDDAAFFAVGSLVDDVLVLTASFNLYLTRPVSSGVIQASGRVVHRSRRLFVAEAVASDSEGRELARGSGTFMRSQIALASEMGYR